MVGAKAVCTSASGRVRAKQGVELAAELAHFFPRLKALGGQQTRKALLLIHWLCTSMPMNGQVTLVDGPDAQHLCRAELFF